MGVVVRRYCTCTYIDFLIIIIIIPTPLVLALFWQQQPYFFVHFKMFFSFLFMLFLCNRANVAKKNIRDRSKIEIMRTWRYNYIDKNVRCVRVLASTETSTCEVPRDVSRKLQLTLCAMMAS